METASFLKQHAVTLIMATITVSSSFVITQQSTNDNTRRIDNLEKYTREVKDIAKNNDKEIAVLKEQQKSNAVNNDDISKLLERTSVELQRTALAVERLSAKVDG